MRVISRQADTGIEVFAPDLESSQVFPMPDGHWIWAVPSTRDAVVHATGGAVARIDTDGREQWRTDIGLHTSADGRIMIDVSISADDSQVWVLAPATCIGREEHDDLIVLDAATGALLSRRTLRFTSMGGIQFPLRDGRMLITLIAAGAGGHVLLAGPDGEPLEYDLGDRDLVAVSPDQRHFMTVEDTQVDVAFHAFPGGEMVTKVPIEAFAELLGPDLNIEELLLEWYGGFLDDETAIVVISGESMLEGDWWRHFRVGARTGEVLGELHIATIAAYDLIPLGDGTFVVTDTDGTLRRM